MAHPEDAPAPADLRADHVFDGGELDCGSGLALLIREHMLRVPAGGVLEVRSRDATVRSDLPPWCRLSGHEYLGHVPGEGATRYFVRRGTGAAAAQDEAALRRDQGRARAYEWRARVRSTGHLQATVYARNHSFVVGQPASFEERDERPSAIEHLVGALGAELAVLFSDACARTGVQVDDIELTVRARLNDPLAALGASTGDPSLRSVEVKVFASTMADESGVRAAWDEATRRAPLLATLRKAAEVDVRLAIV